MRTVIIEYDDINIELARPTILDGQVRRQVWLSLKAMGDATPFYKRYITIFGFFITQIVKCVNFDFEKMSTFTGDTATLESFMNFIGETDEKLCELLEVKVSVLNGFTVEDTEKKIVSGISSNGTLEVESSIPNL